MVPLARPFLAARPIVRSDWSFAAAELVGLECAADGVPAGESDDRFGGVSLALINEFVARRLAEGVVDPCVQVRQRAQDEFLRQTCQGRLRHGGGVPQSNPPDKPQIGARMPPLRVRVQYPLIQDSLIGTMTGSHGRFGNESAHGSA